MEEDEAEVKFRAGKKKEDGKPRPLIVKVKEAEKKERVLSTARKLARKDTWKGFFLAPDLTPKQREEDKKKKEGREKQKTRQWKPEERAERGSTLWLVRGEGGELCGRKKKAKNRASYRRQTQTNVGVLY